MGYDPIPMQPATNTKVTCHAIMLYVHHMLLIHAPTRRTQPIRPAHLKNLSLRDRLSMALLLYAGFAVLSQAELWVIATLRATCRL